MNVQFKNMNKKQNKTIVVRGFMPTSWTPAMKNVPKYLSLPLTVQIHSTLHSSLRFVLFHSTVKIQNFCLD